MCALHYFKAVHTDAAIARPIQCLGGAKGADYISGPGVRRVHGCELRLHRGNRRHLHAVPGGDALLLELGSCGGTARS